MRPLAALLAAIVLACAPASWAQQRIVAVVNDEIISAHDVETRSVLTMVTAGIGDNPEIRKRIAPQVLRALIDERIQLHEALRSGVAVTEKDVADASARIEQNNKMRKGELDKALTQAGVSMPALMAQIRAAIAWQKLANRKLRPQVQITEDEITETLETLKARQGSPEHLLSEIFLPIDNPEQEDEVRNTALNLIQQMQRGTNFAAIAQQFSRTASAAGGGDIGWIQDGQLEPELEAAVKAIRPGEVTAPIRTAGGFYVIGVRGRRTVAQASPDEAVVLLTQLVMQARTPDEFRAAEQLADELRGSVNGCDELAKVAKELRVSPPTEPQRLRVGDINPAIREKVRGLKAGVPSAHLRSGNSVVVLMACSREEPPSGLPSREDVEETIMRQRLDLLSRRYLRDLRRQAYVDIRA
ncbi:MAG: peptidylprolyl isomerase [Alphaproteobacteria bacterium]